MSDPIQTTGKIEREHDRGLAELGRHSDALNAATAMGRDAIAVARECNQTAKELPGVIGQEVRDTSTHVAIVGSVAGGGMGGFLIVLIFIAKLILLFFGKK